MNLHTLTSQQFGKIVKLLNERQKLASDLAGVESQLARLSGGDSLSKPRAKAKSTGKRGALKTAIIRTLTAAGAKGLSIQDISKAVGRPTAAVSVWFYTTGRKIKGLRRVKRGIYTFKA